MIGNHNTLEGYAAELASRACDCSEAKTEDGDHEQAQAAEEASELLYRAAKLLKKAGI